MKFEDFLNSVLKIKGDHMLLFITLIATLIPFTSTTIIFFPDFIKNGNFVMFIVLALVTGFSQVIPSSILGIIAEGIRLKDVDDDTVLFLPMLASLTIGFIWGLASVIYYIFFLSFGLKPFIVTMSIISYLVMPLAFFLLFFLPLRKKRK